MLLVASLVGALAVASVALGAKPIKSGKKPPKPGKPTAHHIYAWHDVPTGSAAQLRGVAAVSRSTAWTSGYIPNTGPGKVFRTLDRGATWQDVSPAGPATLEFRDIEAFGANRAVVLSAGVGTNSRI
jgi:hypothetical protein